MQNSGILYNTGVNSNTGFLATSKLLKGDGAGGLGKKRQKKAPKKIQGIVGSGQGQGGG